MGQNNCGGRCIINVHIEDDKITKISTDTSQGDLMNPPLNVPELLMEIIDKEIYKEDYASITTYFQREPISYDDAIKSVEIIAKSDIFEE